MLFVFCVPIESNATFPQKGLFDQDLTFMLSIDVAKKGGKINLFFLIFKGFIE